MQLQAHEYVKNWYYGVGNVELGPLTIDELREMARDQLICPDHKIKFGSSGNWRSVSDVSPLAAEFEAARLSSVATERRGVRRVSAIQAASRDASLQKTSIDQSLVSTAETNVITASSDGLRQQIDASLDALHQQFGIRFTYELHGGTVTLRGTVASEGERLLARRRISGLNGVRDVVDQIQIGSRTTTSVSNSRAPSPVVLPAARHAHATKPVRRVVRDAGPPIAERIKELVTGANAPKSVTVALAIGFLAFWFVPRAPQRPVAVHPVKGRVTLEGKPLADAAVMLHRVGQTPLKLPINIEPHARTNADGDFVLGTFDLSDGAPNGDFVATVYQVTETIDGNGEKNFGPNLLPPIYATPETSPFRVTISAKTCELDPLNLSRN